MLAIHAGAERDEFIIDERLINLREPVGRHLEGRRIAQMRESQTRPGPVHHVFDQPRAHRIAEHVAEDREEMAVVLNGKTFEPAVPHMSVTVVVPMVATDMSREESEAWEDNGPSHGRREARKSSRSPVLLLKTA